MPYFWEHFNVEALIVPKLKKTLSNGPSCSNEQSTGEISIHWMLQLVSLILIRWIVIYLAPVVQKVDNAIHGMDKSLSTGYHNWFTLNI